MALGESGDWASATQRIVNMINGEADPLEGALPAGYSSNGVLESFSRQFSEDYGVELGMSLPVVLAGFSGACQGAFAAPIVAGNGDVIPASLVMQFMGIAEAGQQKSTLLKEVMEPLRAALDGEAADERRAWTIVEREKAKGEFGDKGVAVDANAAIWDKVYAGGVCNSSVTDQGTPEGIRNNIVRHGGHRMILTAEPDVLREISAYSKGNSGGSIGLLLRGWDQEDLAVDRAGTDAMVIAEPSLPYVIMVQPESFERYTGSGDGTDDFVDRGLFSRTWLWRAQRTEIPDSFEGSFQGAGAALGGSLPATPMTVAREKLAARMMTVALRGNEYRARKGIRQAWQAQGADLWMPRPKVIRREMLTLDGKAGWDTHVKVQNMRLALRRAVQDADALSPGLATILDPLAQRFTSHVMRMAGLLSLADDPGATVVDTAHMEDVATRLVPWLWSGWWQVLHTRLEENARSSISEQVLKNPKGTDLTGQGVILRVLTRLSGNGPASMGGFLASEIFRKGRSAMSKRSSVSSSSITAHLKAELARTVEEKLVEVIDTGELDAVGKPVVRYRLTAAGVLAAKTD